MRATIEIVRNDRGWDARYFDASRGPILVDGQPVPVRQIGQATTGTGCFPLPPSEEIAGLDRKAPWYSLCSGDGSRLEDAWAEILGRDPGPGVAASFGQYLFETLVGSAWKPLVAYCRGSALEIGLHAARSDDEFWRLPWEMMHTEEGFLAAGRKPAVAIARLVASTAQIQGPLALPLRVLFVVGAALGDDRIKAGAEYVGMLRRLKERDLMVHSRVLTEASVDRLHAAVSSFRPSVVHFICHGGVHNGRGYLELRADDGPGAQTCLAEALCTSLPVDDHLPPVVVLNACHSADCTGGPDTVPLAVELVERGVPIVVGMAGRVDDRACRLFTRRFYEALLKGTAVDVSAADGRRAGLMNSSDHERRIDWAMPAIFTGSAVEPVLRVVADSAAHEIEAFSSKFRGSFVPPAFCDRIDVLEAYHGIARTERGAWVLALDVSNAEAAQKDGPHFGMTRVLWEIAAYAAYDNYLPCLVEGLPEMKPGAPAGKGNWVGFDVAEAILSGANRARRHLELPIVPRSTWLVNQLRRRANGECLDLGKEMNDLADDYLDQEPGVPIVAALKRDLIRMVEGCSKTPIILLDNLHAWEDGAEFVVSSLLARDGVGSGTPRMPVVFACRTRDPFHQRACNALKRFFECPWEHVQHTWLNEFAQPAARLAYRQFLMHRNPPLVPTREAEAEIDSFFEENVHGIPSKLSDPYVEGGIRVYLRLKNLVEASDEDLLKGATS